MCFSLPRIVKSVLTKTKGKRSGALFFSHQILMEHFCGEILTSSFTKHLCQSNSHRRVSLHIRYKSFSFQTIYSHPSASPPEHSTDWQTDTQDFLDTLLLKSLCCLLKNIKVTKGCITYSCGDYNSVYQHYLSPHCKVRWGFRSIAQYHSIKNVTCIIRFRLNAQDNGKNPPLPAEASK